MGKAAKTTRYQPPAPAAEVSSYMLWRDGLRPRLATQVSLDGQTVRFRDRLDSANAIRLAGAQLEAGDAQ